MWWGWRQNLSVRGTKGIWVLWAGWWKLSIKGIKVSKLRKEEGWLLLPESGSNTEIVFVLILGLKLSLSKLVQNILQNFLKLYNSVLLDINTVSDIGADLMYILFFFFRLTRDEVESALCYACRLLIKDLVSPLLYTCICLLSNIFLVSVFILRVQNIWSVMSLVVVQEIDKYWIKGIQFEC